MANLPVLRSKEQIVGDLVDAFLARVTGITDLNVGSVMTQFFEAIGQNNFRAAAAIISMIDALSVDRAEGEALQRLARDKNVPIYPAGSSSGKVNITDLSFTKISTTIYSGQPAPVAGLLKIYISDGSKFASTGGTVYIGRGTANVEGPLTYTSVQTEAGGAYWSITLANSSPTTKFHNTGETVIQGQGGNRVIQSGSFVQTSAGLSTTSVQFATTSPATIQDGEITVTNVPVLCQQAGPIGNVPAGAITTATGLPFTASVSNPSPFSNGRPADTDDDIRQRIKDYEQAKAKGTEDAIRVAAVDVVAPDELKKVQSANVVRYADNSAALVFDDGTGYEPLFTGIGIEQIVDQAIGGEKELQLRNKPVAQARLKSNVAGPYNIQAGQMLSVTINGTTTVHTFQASDFKSLGNGTAFEVSASINGDPNIGFLANTFGGGVYVVIYPRSTAFNDIQVNSLSSLDANVALGFASAQEFTARLYKNDSPLYQDGLSATVSTRDKPSWSTAILDGDTLIYTVDNTPPVTTTFTLAAFQAIDPTATVSFSTTIDIWAAVMNSLMPGVAATVSGDVINLTSNRGASSSASIAIIGGSLFEKIFKIGALISSTGRSSDYTFNKQTGQFALAVPLAVNDQITAGSPFTRAKVLTTQLPSGVGSPGRAWIVFDGQAQLIPNGLQATTQIAFTKSPGGQVLTISGRNSVTLNPEGFNLVQDGDWVLVWANSADSASLIANQGYWRVQTSDTGALQMDSAYSVGGVNTGYFTIPSDRLVIVRSQAPIQRMIFNVNQLSDLVTALQAVMTGVNVDLVGSKVRVSTMSSNSSYGDLLVIAADDGGKNLQLPVGTYVPDIPSHLGFNVTSDSEAGIPFFNWDTIATVSDDHTIVEPNYLDLGGEKAEFLEILDRYDASTLHNLSDANKSRRVLATNFSTVTNQVSLDTPTFMQTGENVPYATFMQADDPVIRPGNRFFLRSAYQFDSKDTAIVTVDGNSSTQTYELPVARSLLVSAHSTPTSQSFSATDNQSSLALSDPSSFGSFDFSNFKVWRQANATLTDGTYALLMNAIDFGPSGNRIRVGITYPTSISQSTVSSSVTVSDVIDINLSLPVKTPRSGLTWDGTTSFTTSVVTTNGRDSVTYTYRVGTQPNFGVGGATLSVGDVAILSSGGGLLPANQGLSARVSGFSNGPVYSFTVDMPTGVAQNDNVTFSNMLNQGGTIFITTSGPHNITTGQTIGIWNTAQTNSGNYPFNTTYLATVTGTTTFTVPTPPGVPGGVIASGTHSGNVVTIQSASHGLIVGNIILISGVSTGAYNGLASVSNVVDANTFQYIRSGSSTAISNNGRFDFQSYVASGPAVTITDILKPNAAGGLVTVSAPGNFLSPGDLVQISNTDPTLDAWSNVASYNQYDVVYNTADGKVYKAVITPTVGDRPDLFPAEWAVTTKDLTGIFIVNTTPILNTEFTYYYDDINGHTHGTGGTATQYVVQGSLARALTAGTNLAFALAQATAQQIVDYVSINIPNYLNAAVSNGNPSATISKSTADLGIGSNYLYGTLSSIRTISGTRRIQITVNTAIVAGSTANVTVTTGNGAYSGSYVVLDSVQSGPNYILTCQAAVLAGSTGTVATAGTFTGYLPALMLRDGENNVLNTNLASLTGFPQFNCKDSWINPPAVGEELRLVALTTDQLTRFWNVLVVTGLSNVATIQNSEFGRQIQIMTDTFGSTGSIQVSGGLANNGFVGVVGSASQVNNKIGLFNIPYVLRQGITAKSWIRINQTITQNKILGFTGDTRIQVYADGVALQGGHPGTFQTLRATTEDSTSKFKVEFHGNFIHFLNIGGTSPGLSTNGVQEGDWVRITNGVPKLFNAGNSYSQGNKVNDGSGNRYFAAANLGPGSVLTNPSQWTPYTDYSASTNYTIGQYALYSGRLWYALAINGPGSTIVTPGNDPETWSAREWNVTNLGIFPVVRVFGDGSFWIENPNAIEEVTQLLDPNDLSFYSYDSVMPGDRLVLAGTVLDSRNAGVYTVQDDNADGTYSFPTSSRIYVAPAIPIVSGGFIILGEEFQLDVVQEAKPISLLKKVLAIGPGPATYANVIVDTPNLMNKVSSSLGAYVTLQDKLAFPTAIQYGIDGYRYYQGLIAELNRVIYGDPTDTSQYPGVRAAGTNVDIKPSLVRRISVSLSIRVKTGIPFAEITAQVQAVVAGYVNTLDVGEQVSIGFIVAAAGTVNGVTSVAVTYPTYNAANDLIAIGADERAKVVDPSTDVVVSINGS